METKKKSAPFVNIGSSLLLVIFLILCLVTFATLSLTSAQSNYNFSEKLANRKTDYYSASNQAERILDRIDNVLADTYADTSAAYFSAAERRLTEIKFTGAEEDASLEMNFSTEVPTVAYTVPVNEKQALSVILEILPVNKNTEGYYRIRQWKVVSTEEWSGDNTLQLIGK